jgi:hypothetical protein
MWDNRPGGNVSLEKRSYPTNSIQRHPIRSRYSFVSQHALAQHHHHHLGRAGWFVQAIQFLANFKNRVDREKRKRNNRYGKIAHHSLSSTGRQRFFPYDYNNGLYRNES